MGKGIRKITFWERSGYSSEYKTNPEFLELPPCKVLCSVSGSLVYILFDKRVMNKHIVINHM